MEKMDEGISLVFIPKYIERAINGNGNELNKIAAVASGYNKATDSSVRDDIGSSVMSMLGEKISKYDISTLVAANTKLYQLLTASNGYRMEGLNNILHRYNDDYCDTCYGELLNDLRVTNTNSMSEIKNNGYEFERADETVFVILHDGFTNIVVDDKLKREEFLSGLLNFAFSIFDDELVHNSTLFKAFLRVKK